MAEPSIHFNAVWKKFRRGEHHDTLRDVLLSAGRRRLRRREDADGLSGDEFWAVRDTSFEVRPGETLGIIGGNGAGKSTVLKLLTRILRPNRGDIRVRGRIGALIEVSAGFHPDLTGRENIYLQGSLMGMRQAMIQQKFDQIVEFSGIEQFLDTPVKRYSSGMNARLGFAIAAHLDPDVLIVDEVLAVGDYRFQQRAFGRLEELASSGLPVVIVSHQLDRIAQLCSKAILLASGQVHTAGTAADCIGAYLGQAASSGGVDGPVAFDPPLLRPGNVVDVGGSLTATVRAIPLRPLEEDWVIGVRVRGLKDNHIMLFVTNTAMQHLTLPSSDALEIAADLQAHLIPGQYSAEFYLLSLIESRELCTSAPAYFEVRGDRMARGRAHLGGRLTVAAAARAKDSLA